MTLATAASLAGQTPARIDTALVEILIRADTVQSRIDDARSTIKDYSPNGRYNTSGNPLNYWDQQRVTEATAALPALQADYAAIQTEADPYRNEYLRRGGWTRYAICKTDGGHVHRFEGGDPRVCSTLRFTSQMAWLPEYSGLTPDQLIEKVGYTACTVCFPQAPVSAAWKRTEAAAKRKTADERLAKWQTGRDARAKKVMNAEKRFTKHVNVPDEYGHTHANCSEPVMRMHRDPANPRGPSIYGPTVEECNEARDVRYAKQELARWDEKRPVGA